MAEVLFLGTGAADWDIANKTDFFRRNASALVNFDLMLDCGAHIFDFAESFQMPHLYDAVTDILITHDHDDHVCPDSVLKLAEKQKLRVGCDLSVRDLIGEHANIEYVEFTPYAPQKIGNYTVTSLLANHNIMPDGRIMAYHYIIETPDGKTIFYGLDGAWFLRESWQCMLKHKFDLMVFDCTVGDRADWRLFEHNTIPMLRMMVQEICEKELVKESGILLASHMARTLHGTHDETKAVLSKMGVKTAFDGLKLCL